MQTPFAYNYIGHLYLSVLPFSIKAESFSTPWLLRLLVFHLSHPSKKNQKYVFSTTTNSIEEMYNGFHVYIA